MTKRTLTTILATPLLIGSTFIDFHLKLGGVFAMTVVGLFAYADAKNDIF